MQQTNGSVNSKGVLPDIEPFSPSETGNAPLPRCCQQFSSKNIACEQALLFGQAKRASRERASEGPRGFAARSRVLARLVSLAQIGELARRLLKTHHSAQCRVQMSHHGEQGKIKIETS